MTGFAYNELACFLAVAEHGHFGRAAAALQLTQPAVSKIVRRVEQGVGAALFTRGTHGVALTRSEEHTSELQSQSNLVCRLLLEKKKKKNETTPNRPQRIESDMYITRPLRT